jgi:tetratricopeptide (TPR) repeat protein
MKRRSGPGDRMVSTGMAIAVIVVMLAGAVFVQYSLNSSSASSSGIDQSSPYDTARSVLNLLGGMRQSLAANLWSKTDSIHHGYLHENVFREQALFPYFWLITRLDPHYTMAYYYASWMLARFGRVNDGYKLALEGLRYNPDSSALQFNLASIYFFFKKDPQKARYHLLKAMELKTDEIDDSDYQTFLEEIDNVIAGKRKIHEIVPPNAAHKLQKQAG